MLIKDEEIRGEASDTVMVNFLSLVRSRFQDTEAAESRTDS